MDIEDEALLDELIVFNDPLQKSNISTIVTEHEKERDFQPEKSLPSGIDNEGEHSKLLGQLTVLEDQLKIANVSENVMLSFDDPVEMGSECHQELLPNIDNRCENNMLHAELPDLKIQLKATASLATQNQDDPVATDLEMESECPETLRITDSDNEDELSDVRNQLKIIANVSRNNDFETKPGCQPNSLQIMNNEGDIECLETLTDSESEDKETETGCQQDSLPNMNNKGEVNELPDKLTDLRDQYTHNQDDSDEMDSECHQEIQLLCVDRIESINEKQINGKKTAKSDEETDSETEIKQEPLDFLYEPEFRILSKEMMIEDDDNEISARNDGNSPIDPLIELSSSSSTIIHKLESSCSVIGCSVTLQTNPDICFYQMPICTKGSPISFQYLEKKRRIAWLKCVDIKLDAKRYNVIRICGSHFVYGRPATTLNYYHVDWVPSVNIGENIRDTAKNYGRKYQPFRKDISEWLFDDYESKTVSYPKKTINIIKPVTQTKKFYENTEESDHRYCKDVVNSSKPSSNFPKPPKREKPNVVSTKFTHAIDKNLKTNTTTKSELPSIICLPCKKTFTDFTTYYIHKFSNVNCLISQKCCEICEVYIYDNEALKLHMKLHTNRRGYYCKYCKKLIFGSTIDQMDHIRNNHMDLTKYYFCDKCGKLMLLQSELLYHIKIDGCFKKDEGKCLKNNDINPIKTGVIDRTPLPTTTVGSRHIAENIPVNESYNLNTILMEEYIDFNENEEVPQKKKLKISHQSNEITFERSKPTILSNTLLTKPKPIPKPIYTKTAEQIKNDELKRVQLQNDQLKTDNQQIDIKKLETDNNSIDEKKKYDSMWMCHLCGKFIKSYSFTTHLNVHLDIRLFKCNYCGNSFRTLEYLKKHLNSHEKNRFECDLCPKSFLWWEQFYKHMQKSHPQSNELYICPICNKAITHQAILIYHIKRHQTYECYLCKSAFKRLNHLKRHMKYHKIYKYKKISSVNYKIPKRERKQPTSYECVYCLEIFIGKKALEMHTRNHIVERLYSCKICLESRIGTELEEQEHSASHLNKKPHICELCGKSYFAENNYNIHMRTQHVGQIISDAYQKEMFNDVNESNSKNIVVIKDNTETKSIPLKSTIETIPPKIVNKSIPSESTVESKINLQSTKLTNKKIETLQPPPTNEILSFSNQHKLKTFSCNECSYIFDNEPCFIQHKSEAHRKKFRCNICNQIITNEMGKHIRSHQTCLPCNFEFNSRMEYLKHLQRVHPKQQNVKK